MPLERNAFVRFHYVTVRQSEMLTWVMHDVISSSLGFGTRSMADRHGQDSLAAFIEHFNLLMEAASLSGEYGLTQKLSGALNGVAAYGRKIAKLFTLLVVREERIAIPKAKKIACHRSSPTRVIIEENTLANNRFLGSRSCAGRRELDGRAHGFRMKSSRKLDAGCVTNFGRSSPLRARG
jgi:hypothetical protein